MDFPKMAFVRQVFPAPRLENPIDRVRTEMGGLKLEAKLKPGMRIAVTAGSRGIASAVDIMTEVVTILKSHGAEPFLVPAMGSHGGATAEGQLEVLHKLGITEESVGAPIMSSMDVVEIGVTAGGVPVYIDSFAAAADGIFVVNRVKRHTDFEADIQSGLTKMTVIGLGKQKGAATVHRFSLRDGFENVIPAVGRVIQEQASLIGGLAILENAYHETAQIVGVEPRDFQTKDRELLKRSLEMIPGLPFEDIDVLVVDEMGKQISGTGMDTKVIGRLQFLGQREPESPRIKRIVVLDLAERERGSAVGVGLADIITKRLYDKIDFPATYINALTGNSPEKGRIPFICETDQEAVEVALGTIGPVDMKTARVVWIKNTLELEYLLVSEGLFYSAQRPGNLETLGEPENVYPGPDGSVRLQFYR